MSGANMVDVFDVSQRARKILAAAASRAKNEVSRTWLLWDERGTWERFVVDTLCDESLMRRARVDLGLSEEQIDEEIAGRVLLFSIEAQLKGRR